MTDVEQWLSDLEAKAKNTGQKKWMPVTKEFFGDISYDVEGDKNAVVAFDLPPRVAEFIAAANPAAVLRLVAMVKWMTDVLHNSTGRINDKKYDVSKATWLITAYNATETRHD